MFDFNIVNKLERSLPPDSSTELLLYSTSDDVNKRALAAKHGVNLEYLAEDEDINVLKYVARYSAKYSEEIARYFFNSENRELHTLAALSLSEADLLTDKEIENMETPVLRLLIKNRSSLMQIARIHKVGEIKVLMNQELNKMSRYENKDVTALRNELNSQPFLLGDYMYKMEIEIDDLEDAVTPFDDYLKNEKEKERQKEEINTSDESTDDSDNTDGLSLDDLLSKI